MVGVPRSKGCRNCRRRKKGCDLKRPDCSSCLQLGVQCQYDGRKWKFVDQSAHDYPTIVVPSIDQRVSDRRTIMFPIVLQWSLRKTAFEMQIDEEFWTLYLPQSHTLADSSDGVVCSAVHSAMQELAARDGMVRLALSALVFMSLARVKHDLDLERQATEIYVRALRAVNAALQHARTAQTDATLLACRALGYYEIFRPGRNHRIGTQASDWKRHIAGSARLVELRGHSVLADPEAAELFDNVRMASWTIALLWRGRYGLDGQSDHNLPRRPQSRALLDRFLVIVEKLPPILHRLDQWGAEGLQGIGTSGLRKMYFTLVGVCEDLRAWQRDALAKCLRDQWLAHASPEPTRETLASVFETKDYCWKVLIVYHWSACLVVHTTVATAHDLLSSRCATTSFSEVTRPGWLDPFSYADLISLHLPALFCSEAGLWGAQNGVLPLALCIHFVAATAGADSQEWKNLGDLIKRSRIGGSIKDFMRSLANEGAPVGHSGDPSVNEDAERLGSLWFWGWASNHVVASDSFSESQQERVTNYGLQIDFADTASIFVL